MERNKNDLGDLWGAQVRQSRRQTAGEVNFLGDPQYLGVISVRIDLSHMDKDIITCPCKIHPNAGTALELLILLGVKTQKIGQSAGKISAWSRKILRDYTMKSKRFAYDIVRSLQRCKANILAPDPQNLFYGWVFFEALNLPGAPPSNRRMIKKAISGDLSKRQSRGKIRIRSKTRRDYTLSILRDDDIVRTDARVSEIVKNSNPLRKRRSNKMRSSAAHRSWILASRGQWQL